MTEEHRSDLVDEFMSHYLASETRPAVDQYLSALRSLVPVPTGGSIEESE